ncbi:hypothetical protein Actkin_04800 [Actinokineospora sp. UTMC 2448]|nr:hypothetical protein Actkin_04800 [Actinokineospora sp. UTMC 2448]
MVTVLVIAAWVLGAMAVLGLAFLAALWVNVVVAVGEG